MSTRYPEHPNELPFLTRGCSRGTVIEMIDCGYSPLELIVCSFEYVLLSIGGT